VATIYDVAERAGVSIKSVSRVFNNEPHVTEKLRLKVLDASAALDFRPNVSARGLAGKSRIVLVLVDAALTLSHLRSEHGNLYFDRLQLGAMLRCRENGYHLIVELVTPGAEKLSETLNSLRPDGVVLTPPSCDDVTILDKLDQAGTPYARISPSAFVGRGLRVFIDEITAAAEMTRMLIDLGHRRIGFIAGPNDYGASQARRAGYLQALAAAGLAAKPQWMAVGDFTFDSGLLCAGALLNQDDRPSAIFASNDDMALAVVHKAAELGLAVPSELSVAGFDDALSARFCLPPLTTVRQPISEMASRAVELLTGADTGEEPVREAKLAYSLIVRGSTAPPAAQAG
jgi:LacI family transcriptional regulator